MSAVYLMNPAEDVVMYGDQLAEGMWVLAESPTARFPSGGGEDAAIRRQRFRRVTQLRRTPPVGDRPEQVTFVGEWIDGYQQPHQYAMSHAWIVKKDSVPVPAPGDAA